MAAKRAKKVKPLKKSPQKKAPPKVRKKAAQPKKIVRKVARRAVGKAVKRVEEPRKEEPRERAGVATFKGNPLTLLGPETRAGDKAPDFIALSTALAPVRLADSAGKVRILSSVPSLDTPVCDRETRRFNEEAAKIPGVEILTVSADLPFAQARWCGAAGVDKVTTLSDHRDLSFGLAYGVAIKELRLLARAVFVVDASDTIRHVEIVKEITDEPDYDAAVTAAREAGGAPAA